MGRGRSVYLWFPILLTKCLRALWRSALVEEGLTDSQAEHRFDGAVGGYGRLPRRCRWRGRRTLTRTTTGVMTRTTRTDVRDDRSREGADGNNDEVEAADERGGPGGG